MEAVNRYYADCFAPEDISAGKHREAVGGLWEELGKLQFDFLTCQGLKPHHRLLDVGCGALRGGVHFICFMDPGNYFGADLNASLIEAGKHELELAGITNREPHLLVTDCFEVENFGVQFDYALALSVFTHLPMNHIIRCLVGVSKVLKPGGVFFSTFFQAPRPGFLDQISHNPGEITTHFDRDPFHYSFSELEWMGKIAGLKATLIGAWNHPRDQRMIVFSHG